MIDSREFPIGQMFSIQNRIYYHDTDAGGVVYYATYLEHLEEGRYEFFRSLGIELAEYAKNGVEFPVVHLEVEYKSPARFADSITITTAVERTGNASIHFVQEIKRGDQLLVKAKTVWACIGIDFKSIPLPGRIREALEAAMQKVRGIP